MSIIYHQKSAPCATFTTGCYQRDGMVFGNFERRLPRRERGYYREYTVPTPGDRGARRIVAGAKGEFFYTADHYNTFHRIRE